MSTAVKSALKTDDTAALYRQCRQCPRNCGADRLSAQPGFCREGAALRVAFAGLHFGEEPPITGKGGSGTIFFTGCTLRCKFCQNFQISQDGLGKEVDSAQFTQICRKLQDAGAENINLVTGSHHIPKIADFLADARNAGITIPFCWNSSAYESVTMLERLKGLVTVWLPDFKTLDGALARSLFDAPDYPEVAAEAIRWMIANNPLRIESLDGMQGGEISGKITSGVIIRHLFLPGKFEQTDDVLRWLKQNADSRAIVSLMSQYTPIPQKRGKITEFDDRLVTAQEDEDIRDLIDAYDFEWLFYQELSDDTSWLPDFRRGQPFSNALAKPLWHCLKD